ncbi:MAG: hypothetical protein IJT43_09225 [Stomatobaculum sp.]|nr:hypothetical protein [Stomatobaculum sp.]
MTENTVVLCGANSYNEKYYLAPEFESLPESVRNELKILCVSITEECGGILTLEFDSEGNLNFVSRAEDGDYLFDDISSGMKIGRARFEHRELLEGLELYYRVRFLGMTEEEAEEKAE